MDKSKIIEDIAFYEQYPTVEAYLAKRLKREIILGKLVGLTEDEVIEKLTNEYESRVGVAKVALSNGYQGGKFYPFSLN